MICCKNIVNVTLFFLNSSPDFGNHNFFFLPFLAMTLPQLPKKNFIYFDNAITTISLSQNFFELIITNYVWFIVKML